MTTPPKYVGSSDFHDGFIRETSRHERGFEVIVEGASGKRYRAVFHEPKSVSRSEEVGMMLYALTEAASEEPGFLTYTFLNWHEDDERRQLKIVARSFDCGPIE